MLVLMFTIDTQYIIFCIELTLCVRIPFERGVLDTTLCDKVSQCQVGDFLRVLRFPP